MNRKICYCFDYTEEDIIDDLVLHNGQSTILEKITLEKRNGTCQCRTRHPEKR